MTAKKKPYTKRYEEWKRTIATTSLFVLICGGVAVIYFSYRTVLLASPIVAIEQSLFNSPDEKSVMCQEDEGSKLLDSSLVLSAAYQERIQKQKVASPNSVVNANLSQVNEDSGNPLGYSHSVDDDNASYQYIAEPNSGVKFLRAINMKERIGGQISPSWQMDSVPLSAGKTYAYSFSYRSTIPVDVSVETTVNGQARYADVTKLEATGGSWRQFTAHLDNNSKATSLRVSINGRGVGQVDSKDFDVHQISDGRLSKGIVSVTFDDGWKSVGDNAFSLLEKYDIRTTQYIVSETAEHKLGEYMTYDMIRKLKAAGHEIGSHSLNHCNQTELPAQSLQNNAVKSKEALEKQNLGPIRTFAYPLGQYNKKTQSVYEKQYPLIRTSDAGYNDRYFDETNIRSQSMLKDTDDATLRSWLSYAKEHRLWVVLVYHRVDESGEYNVTSEQLERQLKMVHESGLTVAPMSEAAASIRK